MRRLSQDPLLWADVLIGTWHRAKDVVRHCSLLDGLRSLEILEKAEERCGYGEFWSMMRSLQEKKWNWIIVHDFHPLMAVRDGRDLPIYDLFLC
jgi:hypothetical protein